MRQRGRGGSALATAMGALAGVTAIGVAAVAAPPVMGAAACRSPRRRAGPSPPGRLDGAAPGAATAPAGARATLRRPRGVSLPGRPHPVDAGTRFGPGHSGSHPRPPISSCPSAHRAPLPLVVFAHGWNSDPAVYPPLLVASGPRPASSWRLPIFPDSTDLYAGSPVSNYGDQALDISFVITLSLARPSGRVVDRPDTRRRLRPLRRRYRRRGAGSRPGVRRQSRAAPTSASPVRCPRASRPSLSPPPVPRCSSRSGSAYEYGPLPAHHPRVLLFGRLSSKAMLVEEGGRPPGSHLSVSLLPPRPCGIADDAFLVAGARASGYQLLGGGRRASSPPSSRLADRRPCRERPGSGWSQPRSAGVRGAYVPGSSFRLLDLALRERRMAPQVHDVPLPRHVIMRRDAERPRLLRPAGRLLASWPPLVADPVVADSRRYPVSVLLWHLHGTTSPAPRRGLVVHAPPDDLVRSRRPVGSASPRRVARGRSSAALTPSRGKKRQGRRHRALTTPCQSASISALNLGSPRDLEPGVLWQCPLIRRRGRVVRVPSMVAMVVCRVPPRRRAALSALSHSPHTRYHPPHRPATHAARALAGCALSAASTWSRRTPRDRTCRARGRCPTACSHRRARSG